MASKEDSATEAGQPEKDELYDNRPVATKVIRIITVMAYLVSVSFVAIALSGYYIFLWHPPPGGSLSLRDPHSEYLMESPPPTSNSRNISEIIAKINLFRKNSLRREFNRTSLRDGSRDVGNSTKMINRTGNYGEAPDRSTGVYHTISENQLEESLNKPTERLRDAEEAPKKSTDIPSTSEGLGYLDGLVTTAGAAGDSEGGNGTYGDNPDEESEGEVSMDGTDDFIVMVPTTPDGVQEKTTAKLNATDSLIKEKLIHPIDSVSINEDQPIERPTELESSLDILPTISPTISEYLDISEENVEEPLDIEFDNDNSPRR